MIYRGGFRGGAGVRTPIFFFFFFFAIICFFCDHFEELHTVLIEVKLITLDIRLPKYYQNIFNTQAFAVRQTVIMLF